MNLLKNGNKVSILQLILVFFVWFIAVIVIGTAEIDGVVGVMTTFIGGTLIYAIYFTRFYFKSNSRLIGFATDTNGRIFRVMAMNNEAGLYIGGLATGHIADQLGGGKSSLGENIGGAVGAVAGLYTLERTANQMSNPEVIAKIIESFPNVTGVNIFEILKVFSITDKKSI